MSTDLVVDLRAVAEAINGEHEAAEAALQQGLERALGHAVRAGRLLLDAKGQLSHGDWLPWIEEHVAFSVRRAQEYMQLAMAPELPNARESAHLTIDAALRQVRKPRPAPERPSAPADVASALQGLAGDAPSGTLDRRLDEARDRLQSDSATAWTPQQTRKRVKAIALIDDVRSKLSDAANPSLSGFAIGEILRSAEVLARQASAMLDELAFGFER